MSHERLDLVVVGHVDHGKSTVVGRLLADTGALPIGKLEEVKARCLASARPFEYAFLLDALKAEQAQGITIDAARCFFKTANRHVILNDAPGHIEFLKNMITGAARAQAALLVIDAKEGIRENSMRHGYLVSLLGIKQVCVLINKMDLVGFSEETYETLKKTYGAFLDRLGVHNVVFLPIAALIGANIAEKSKQMPWFSGPTVLEQIDRFSVEDDRSTRPLRLGVQDIYKFTADGDERRIIVGSIESGTLRAGDTVVFAPSGKRSQVASLEVFNAPTPKQFTAGQAIGFTMVTQVYVRPGELAYRTDETPPKTATRLRATVFWMGLAPLRLGKRYKLKLGANRVPVELVRVHSLLDATSLSTSAGITQVSRHEVAEVELETLRPVAFDPADVDERTARFVLVDGYDIAGCGVILSGKTEEDSLLTQRLAKRARTWKHSLVTAAQRRSKLGQTGKFVVFTGPDDAETAKTLHQRAQALEAQLFAHGRQTAFLSIADLFADLADGHEVGSLDREEHLDLLGELAHAMTEAGLIVIGALPGADTSDLERLRQINQPNDLTVVLIGDNEQDINADLRLDHLETETPDLIAIEDHLLQSGIFTQNQRK